MEQLSSFTSTIAHIENLIAIGGNTELTANMIYVALVETTHPDYDFHDRYNRYVAISECAMQLPKGSRLSDAVYALDRTLEIPELMDIDLVQVDLRERQVEALLATHSYYESQGMPSQLVLNKLRQNAQVGLELSNSFSTPYGAGVFTKALKICAQYSEL